MKNIFRKFCLVFVMSSCALPALSTALLWDEDEVLGELVAWENSSTYGDRKTCLGQRVTLFINDQSTSLNGTSGNDVIWVEMNRVNATIDAKGGDDLICVFGNNVTVKGGIGSDAIYLNGERAAKYIVWGDSGNDYIYAYQSGDAISQLDIRGGSGDDTVFCELYSSGVGCKAEGGSGNDKLHGGSGVNLLRGGEGNDDIWGYEGDDQLFGDGGDDRIYGGDGNDRIQGGTGSDRLLGQNGNDNLYEDATDSAVDYIDGGVGNDCITVSDTTSIDTLLNYECHLVGSF